MWVPAELECWGGSRPARTDKGGRVWEGPAFRRRASLCLLETGPAPVGEAVLEGSPRRELAVPVTVRGQVSRLRGGRALPSRVSLPQGVLLFVVGV